MLETLTAPIPSNEEAQSRTDELYGDERDLPGPIAAYKFPDGSERIYRLKILGDSPKYPGGVAEAFGHHYVRAVNMDTGTIEMAIPSYGLKYETAPAIANQAPTIEGEPRLKDEQLDLTNEAGWDGTPAIEAVSSEGLPIDRYPNAPGPGTTKDVVTEPPVVEAPPPPDLLEAGRAQVYSTEEEKRVKTGAKEYFKRFRHENFRATEQVQLRIIEARHEIDTELSQMRERILQKYQEKGSQNADPDAKARIEQKVTQDVEALRAGRAAAKAVELVAEPSDDAKRGERKKAGQDLEKLMALLSMPQAEFAQTMADWQHYEEALAHSEADKSDGSEYKQGLQRTAEAQGSLDQAYGGALGAFNALPLDKSEGGALTEAMQTQLGWQQEMASADPDESAILMELGNSDAIKLLSDSLRKEYEKQGLNEAEIELKLTENAPILEKWLAGAIRRDNPLEDLKSIDRIRNVEQMRKLKREKIGKYLGPSIAKRALRVLVGREQLPTMRGHLSLMAEMNRTIDPTGALGRAGAEAMRHPERMNSLWGRVMNQLQTARHLSRNQGILRSAHIYARAAEMSFGDSMVSAWEAIPDEQKEKVRKQWMLGKAAATASIRKLAAKAAQKAGARG